jgi:hypothetical protein
MRQTHGIQAQLTCCSQEIRGVRRSGRMRSNITTHWTEARVSLDFIRQLGGLVGCVRARSIRALCLRFALTRS